MTSESGGDTNSRKSAHSWAYMIGRSLPQSWDKNILEIVLEKDLKGPYGVSENDCARLLNKIGLDTRVGVHIEEIQICPNGKGVILVTLKPGIPVRNFCRYEVLQVTESGTRAVLIKPAGR